MVQDGGDRGESQAKDFLALTHGQEWVAFYESFDKLVQDNLARSSDLLRRAMSLPEVADREVAQIKTEMAGKLAAERARNQDFLAKLKEEIAASHRQVSLLAIGVGSILADIERLSQRVSEAITSFEATAPAATPAAPRPDARALPPLNGTGQPESQANGSFTGSPATETPAPAAVKVDEAPAPDPVAIVAAAPQIASDAEDHNEPSASVDLGAIAAAEAAKESVDTVAADERPVSDGDPDQSAAIGAERARPHWLSVTRVGSRT